MLVLEGRRIDERYIKLQQKNKRLLMETEVLNINKLFIHESWNFELDAKYIKTKKIIGDVFLKLNHIPKWLNDIEIDGFFDCNRCNLTSLKNCPKIINRTFWCNDNNLTSLDDGPTYVGNNYHCYNNDVQFTDEYVRSICDVKFFIFKNSII